MSTEPTTTRINMDSQDTWAIVIRCFFISLSFYNNNHNVAALYTNNTGNPMRMKSLFV